MGEKVLETEQGEIKKQLEKIRDVLKAEYPYNISNIISVMVLTVMYIICW